jgi:hypothetical protein
MSKQVAKLCTRLHTETKHDHVVLTKNKPDYFHKPDYFYSPYEEWGSAKCAICNVYLGWYCPKSQSHQCSYEIFSKDGSIKGYNHDQCRFCGQPDERK